MDTMQKKTPSDEEWRGKKFAFFNHTECEVFPCHKTERKEDFNCLFCYCPLYILDDECGGNFKYRKNGVKDCTGCSLPHVRDNYGYIKERFKDIAQKMAEARKQQGGSV